MPYSTWLSDRPLVCQVTVAAFKVISETAILRAVNGTVPEMTLPPLAKTGAAAVNIKISGIAQKARRRFNYILRFRSSNTTKTSKMTMITPATAATIIARLVPLGVSVTTAAVEAGAAPVEVAVVNTACLTP